MQDHHGLANAGASQVAGELCSPYVFSTSWKNDQTPEAMGKYMNQKGVKKVFQIGPNYAAGKDMLQGKRNTYKGEVVGEENPLARSARFLGRALQGARGASRTPSSSSIRAAPAFSSSPNSAGRPQRTDAALPGVLDRRMSLPRLKDLALGVPGAQEWVNDLPNEANKRFVADYIAKYKTRPSFYGAQSYERACCSTAR